MDECKRFILLMCVTVSWTEIIFNEVFFSRRFGVYFLLSDTLNLTLKVSSLEHWFTDEIEWIWLVFYASKCYFQTWRRLWNHYKKIKIKLNYLLDIRWLVLHSIDYCLLELLCNSNNWVSNIAAHLNKFLRGLIK